MRRLSSFLALVALAWSQSVALQCPLTARTDHGLVAIQGPISAREAAGSPHTVTNTISQAGAPASGGGACHVVMTCAWAMVDASATSPALQLATALHSAVRWLRVPHATADLLADPPPPRLHA